MIVPFDPNRRVVMTSSIAAAVEEVPAFAAIVNAGVLWAIGVGEVTPGWGWRESHPHDDPTIPADLWINDEHRVWIKRDEHDPTPRADGRCGWCGDAHESRMAIFTIMRPEDF